MDEKPPVKKSRRLSKKVVDRAKLVSSLSPGSDVLWTVEEVAAYLRLQPGTVRRMARTGELPAIKIGRGWRFRSSTIAHLGEKEEEGLPGKE
jgi:excisionase family DNA binding protein